MDHPIYDILVWRQLRKEDTCHKQLDLIFLLYCITLNREIFVTLLPRTTSYLDYLLTAYILHKALLEVFVSKFFSL